MVISARFLSRRRRFVWPLFLGLTWYYPPPHPWPWHGVQAAVRLQHRKRQPNTSSCLSWKARPGVIEERGDAVLSSLVKDGSVTWSATAVAPARRLPTPWRRW